MIGKMYRYHIALITRTWKKGWAEQNGNNDEFLQANIN